MTLESEWREETSLLDAEVSSWRSAPAALFADYLEAFAHNLRRDLATRGTPIETVTSDLLDAHRMLVIVSERIGLDPVGFEQLLHTRRVAQRTILGSQTVEISLVGEHVPIATPNGA